MEKQKQGLHYNPTFALSRNRCHAARHVFVWLIEWVLSVQWTDDNNSGVLLLFLFDEGVD